MDEVSPDFNSCCVCDINLKSDTQRDATNHILSYKCPACTRKYCSVKCCNDHKTKFECSGLRNKTPYISLAKFDQSQFLDDYFFLEGINEDLERSQRKIKNIIETTSKNSNKSGCRRNRRYRRHQKKAV